MSNQVLITFASPADAASFDSCMKRIRASEGTVGGVYAGILQSVLRSARMNNASDTLKAAAAIIEDEFPEGDERRAVATKLRTLLQ